MPDKISNLSSFRLLHGDRLDHGKAPNTATSIATNEDTERTLFSGSSTTLGSRINTLKNGAAPGALPPQLYYDVNSGRGRKLTWAIFMQGLEIFQEVCGEVFPPLKGAVGGLLVVLKQYERMSDVAEDLSLLCQKIAALQAIVTRHTFSSLPESLQRGLKQLSDWILWVTTAIKAAPPRSYPYDFFCARENHENVVKHLDSLVYMIDLFMLNSSIEMHIQIGNVDKKLDDKKSETLLKRLNHVDVAGYHSQKGDRCLEGTRSLVIADILSWCNGSSNDRVFWLNGMAGTGKSAIARTICETLGARNLLGGSFFCSRRATAREQDIKGVIPTLAWQLSLVSPAYKEKLLERLEKVPDIATATVEKQVQELIVKPFQDPSGKKNSVCSSFQQSLILAIDALDEGSKGDDISMLLRAILTHAATSDIPLKFFVTSRPQREIQGEFQDTSHRKGSHALYLLHMVEDTIVQGDIRLYVEDRLRSIKKKSRYCFPHDWPPEELTEELVRRAGKLFIYASTACNYIERNPIVRLKSVVNAAGVGKGEGAMDEIYSFILNVAMDPDNDVDADLDVLNTIRQCLTILVYAREKFSVSEFAALLHKDVDQLQIAVDQLHSIIFVPTQLDEEITTLHASLGDYLSSRARSGDFYIDKERAHFSLLQLCFDAMRRGLHFNIAQASTSFQSNEDQNLGSWLLPRHLVYAAGRWSDHLLEDSPLDQSSVIVAWIRSTLMPKFLFWLEVISLDGKVHEVPSMLSKLLPFIKHVPDLVLFISNAVEFVHASRDAISFSVPHIYISAFALHPRGSTFRTTYQSDFNHLARIKYTGTERMKAWKLCLKGHTDGVKCAAFSPDGAYIVSGSFDATIRIWDLRTGLLSRLLEGHHRSVYCVAFSPDGRYIVSGSGDWTLRVWDVGTGQLVMQPLEGHTDWVTCVAYSSNSDLIVSGSWDNTVRVWNAANTRLIMEPLQGHVDRIHSVIFSPDSTRIVSGSEDKTVRVWDAKNGQPIAQLFQGESEHVRSLAFSPDGGCLVTGLSDGSIRMWDTQSGEPAMKPLRGHGDLVSSVDFSGDGAYIVSGSHDKTVRVWDARTGQSIIAFQAHPEEITSIAFSPDGTRILSASYDGLVYVWDATIDQPMQLLHGHTNGVTYAAFSPDGTRIISGSFDKAASVWDAMDGTLVAQPLQGNSYSIVSMALSLDGTCIAAGLSDNTVRLWDVESGRSLLKPFEGHTDLVGSVAFSLDGARVVSGSFDGTVRLWDATNGQHPTQAHILGPSISELVYSVAFSPDGARIVSGSSDKVLRIWDALNGRLVMRPLRRHTDAVRSAVFSRDGSQIVSGSNDCTVCLWNALTGEHVRQIGKHAAGVISVAFSPDGTRIVSGSQDNTVRLWDTENDRKMDLRLEPLQGNSDIITCVAFSPDGGRVVSASSNNTIRVWDVGVVTKSQESTTHQLGLLADHGNLQVPHLQSPYASPLPFDLPRIPLSGTRLYSSDPRDLFTFEDGWILGSRGERLLWIPENWRLSLYMSRTLLIISSTRALLDLSDFVCGADWASCYMAN